MPIDPKRALLLSSGVVGKSEHKTAEYVINGSSGDDAEEDEDDEEDEDQNKDGEDKEKPLRSSKLSLAKNGPGILKLTLQDVTNLFVK